MDSDGRIVWAIETQPDGTKQAHGFPTEAHRCLWMAQSPNNRHGVTFHGHSGNHLWADHGIRHDGSEWTKNG